MIGNTSDMHIVHLHTKLEKVRYLYNNIAYNLINEIQEKRQTPIPAHKVAATMLMRMLNLIQK